MPEPDPVEVLTALWVAVLATDEVTVDDLVDEPLAPDPEDEAVSAEMMLPVETNTRTAAMAPHFRIVCVRRRRARTRAAARRLGSD